MNKKDLDTKKKFTRIHKIQKHIKNQCPICGHQVYISEEISMFPYLDGKLWVERLHCIGCQKILMIEYQKDYILAHINEFECNKNTKGE